MKLFLSFLSSLFRLYIDGFRDMSLWGRNVWLVLLIKLFIIFAILRIFFFPDFLGRKYDNDAKRSEYVRNQILNAPDNND